MKNMAKSEIRDMTTGSPFKLILGFAVPMLLGLLFQQFYSMVDTIIVGKYLGVKALAAVGSTGSINFMIIGFCTGVCSGFAIPVARDSGQEIIEGLESLRQTRPGCPCFFLQQWLSRSACSAAGSFSGCRRRRTLLTRRTATSLLYLREFR